MERSFRRKLIAALVVFLTVSAQAKPAPIRRIGKISIDARDVFNTESGPEAKWIYRVGNSAHWATNADVIRRELLFAEGDVYDPALIKETERNLRRLPFIRRARVMAVINEHGLVDVKVRTSDAWSLEVVAHFKRVGGVTHWKGGLTERNLMGQGKEVSAIYSQQNTAPYRALNYRDPQFLGRRHLDYALAAESGPGSRHFSMGLNRPFFASIARSALGFNGSYNENRVNTYSGETVTGLVQQRTRELGLSYGRALGISTRRTRRLRLGALNRKEEFGVVPGEKPGVIPEANQFNFLQLGLEWEQLDFIKEQRIQKFTHDEDYNLGFGIFPSVAWSPHFRPLDSTQSRIVPRVSLRKGFSADDQLLFLESAYGSTYINGGNGHRLASIDVLYFLRGFARQTFAFHTAFDHGWELDPALRLTLGEANGLRGYGLSQFSGDRRFRLNIEDRIFIVDELLSLIDVGGVLFVDSGYVWPPGRAERFSDLKSSIGAGLRLAPSKSGSNSPVRVDFARALSHNGTRSRWSLSILAGHAFGPASQ